jgi:hypothetical protein
LHRSDPNRFIHRKRKAPAPTSRRGAFSCFIRFGKTPSPRSHRKEWASHRIRLKSRHSRRGELTQSIRASEKDTAFLRCSDALRDHSFPRIRHHTESTESAELSRAVSSALRSSASSVVSGGMARPSPRHDPWRCRERERDGMRQGAIRVFSRTEKPGCFAVPARLRKAGLVHAPSATGRPSPPTAFCSFLATAVDPSPKLRGRGVSGYFCFPGKNADGPLPRSVSSPFPALPGDRTSWTGLSRRSRRAVASR